MAKKRKRLIDQVYNGAFRNMDYAPETKQTFKKATTILITGVIISLYVSSNEQIYRKPKRSNQKLR